jgi:hypothetical protein
MSLAFIVRGATRPDMCESAKSQSLQPDRRRKVVALPIYSARRPSSISCSGILAPLRRPAALVGTYIR